MKRLFLSLTSLALLTSAFPALAADTTRPIVGPPAPSQATAGMAVTVTAGVSDADSGIASCNLYVDNDDVGTMTVSGSTASKSYVFAQVGIHTMFVFCRDAVNNFQSGDNTSVHVTPPSSGSDHTPPAVGVISPLSASVGTATEFSAQATDAGTGVSGCSLIVNGFGKGTMAYSGGIARLTHTFDAPGTYAVHAECFDVAGNTGTGQDANVAVSIKVGVTPGLIKTVCPAGSANDHPCRAVYYRSSDGKRHAFPNDKVFFTWYADFSTVLEISGETMATYPLGKTVTYRPGSKMVKFTTLAKVYAVAKGGRLRWITSEEAAASLYGADWNKKVDDISDVFYLDYGFGDDIDSVQDFSPEAERASAPTVESNF